MKINKVMEDREICGDTWDNLELEHILYYRYFWKDVEFKNVSFKGCMFEQSTFVNCEFNNCTFIECRFIKNVCQNVKLKDVKIYDMLNNITLATERGVR